MKPLFIIVIIIIVISILIFIRTVGSLNQISDQVEIMEMFANSNSNKKGQYCFDTCPSRNTLRNEILILKDYLDSIQIKISNFDDKMDDYNRQLKELQAKQNQDSVDDEDKYETLNKAHDAAKDQAVASLSKPASQMSGLPPDEVDEKMKKHLSVKVTPASLNDFKNSAPKQSKEDIENHNRKLAKIQDRQSSADKKQVSNNGEKTVNSYINKNRASCNCPDIIKKQNPGLEDNIIKQANYYGFEKHWHGLKHCSTDDDCAIKYAKEKLNELCNQHGCEVVNPDGQYPYNLQQINQKSIGKRPKNYNFPQ